MKKSFRSEACKSEVPKLKQQKVQQRGQEPTIVNKLTLADMAKRKQMFDDGEEPIADPMDDLWGRAAAAAPKAKGKAKAKAKPSSGGGPRLFVNYPPLSVVSDID